MVTSVSVMDDLRASVALFTVTYIYHAVHTTVKVTVSDHIVSHKLQSLLGSAGECCVQLVVRIYGYPIGANSKASTDCDSEWSDGHHRATREHSCLSYVKAYC
jgi:hypothetical protein